jgi:MoxR-like ATPase
VTPGAGGPGPSGPAAFPGSVGELTGILRDGGYLADRGLATTLFVALSLQRPVLLEGEVGVGKTEAAKALASVFGRKLIRLQCYEGCSSRTRPAGRPAGSRCSASAPG